MTAAASKYSGASPFGPRNASGKIPGTTIPAVEANQAIPVPSAISVNMLNFPVRTDCQPRSKNTLPPQSTTALARTNCIQGDAAGLTTPPATTISPIATTTTGTVRTAETTSLRVKSFSSGFSAGAPPAGGASGSRAMPQSGQLPGPSETTSGCMEQIYFSAGAPPPNPSISASSAMPQSGQAPGSA